MMRVIYKVSVDGDNDFQPLACDDCETMDEVIRELLERKPPTSTSVRFGDIKIEVYQYTDRRAGTWEL